MAGSDFKKYFFWVIVLLLAILSYLIIKDFLIALVSSFVLAYLLLPLHRLFSRALNKKLSAVIVLILLSIVIIVPLFFMGKSLVNQVSGAVSSKQALELADSAGLWIDKLPIDSRFIEIIKNKLPSLIEKAGEALFNFLAYLFSSIPNLLLLIIIIFFVSYFLLVGWDSIVKIIESIIPFKNKKKLVLKLANNAKNIVYGSLLIAIISFVAAAIGFKIAGSELFIFLAFLVAIAVFVPLLGPVLVWAPMLIFDLIQANYYSAIIVAITGVVLSSLINGLLFTLIVSKKARIHPIIILLGILGGVKLFGLFGFIIGPLVLSFFIDFVIHAAKEKTG